MANTVKKTHTETVKKGQVNFSAATITTTTTAIITFKNSNNEKH